MWVYTQLQIIKPFLSSDAFMAKSRSQITNVIVQKRDRQTGIERSIPGDV